MLSAWGQINMLMWCWIKLELECLFICVHEQYFRNKLPDWQITQSHLVSLWQQEMKWRGEWCCVVLFSYWFTLSLSLRAHFRSVSSTCDASSHMTDITHRTSPASQSGAPSASASSSGPKAFNRQAHQLYVHLLLRCFCTAFPRVPRCGWWADGLSFRFSVDAHVWWAWITSILTLIFKCLCVCSTGLITLTDRLSSSLTSVNEITSLNECTAFGLRMKCHTFTDAS